MDVQVGDLFVRFGRQILSWGETDAFRVLDNINPLDSSFGGFLISLDERRVPLDMVRANYYFGSFGPFSEIFLEGYAAFDNEWGGYPGIPQGSPWQLPNLGRPNANLITFSIKPPTTVENTRGGGQLKFNAAIPAIGDATFGIAHYYTYFDLPALQLTAARPLLTQPAGQPGEAGLIADPSNLYDDGAAVHAIQTAQRVQVTGASSTFVIPSRYARKIFLGGEPVIRTELAYFHREPRYRQSEIDPFFFAVAQPGQPLPNEEVVGKRRVGDSWNFVVGVDMNQFIRWLNPQTSFFFTTQFFYRHLNGAPKRGAFSYNQILTQNVIEGEVLPVPETTDALGAPQFVHHPVDQYLQTLLITTSYAGGQIIPSLTLFYDWFGSFVAIPSVTLSRDPFRFTLQYNYLNASRLRGASGTSLLRDRDNVLFQFEYVL
jgi:hypothetical protein